MINALTTATTLNNYDDDDISKRIVPSPFRLSVQISIEEFLMHPAGSSKDHKLLYNPLSAEFGVRTAEQLDSLISDTLPDFKLVRLV